MGAGGSLAKTCSMHVPLAVTLWIQVILSIVLSLCSELLSHMISEVSRLPSAQLALLAW